MHIGWLLVLIWSQVEKFEKHCIRQFIYSLALHHKAPMDSDLRVVSELETFVQPLLPSQQHCACFTESLTSPLRSWLLPPASFNGAEETSRKMKVLSLKTTFLGNAPWSPSRLTALPCPRKGRGKTVTQTPSKISWAEGQWFFIRSVKKS